MSEELKINQAYAEGYDHGYQHGDHDFASMPTGPWVKGGTPDEDGRYLACIKELPYPVIAFYGPSFLSDERGWSLGAFELGASETVLRYAKINEVKP